MKKELYLKVLDYLKTVPYASQHQIAENIGEKDLDVMAAVSELKKKNYVQMCPPRPLSADNDCSCYFKSSKKDFNAKDFEM